jgi:pimeloyl-ACP methyl ester carboxylesterase
MPRLILIHGYVEDPTIFDTLLPLLPPFNVLAISVETEFDRWPARTPISAHALAVVLAERYAITANDVVMGHSMGGWIAINIKAVTGATVIQLSSFTNQRKVVSPIYQAGLLNRLANTGFLQTQLAVDYVKKRYPFAESKTLNFFLLDRLRTMRPAYIGWQLSVLFAPVPFLAVQPDLRVHARADNIVRPPDEPFAEVPGDHFSLVFHAKAVAEPVLTLFELKHE